MLARTRPTALLLSVSLLAGCAVGPDYRSPDIAVSPRFLGQDGVAHRQVQSKADLQSWWAGFDDALLTRFITLALEQNLDIAQAAARVAQSRASLRQADSALLPSANVSAQGARAYQSVETQLGQVLDATPNFDRSGSYYDANLGASWELDVFGGLRRGREAARAEYQASEAAAVATQLAVAAQTADVYVTIRGLQARIAIARQQAETRRQLLSTVKLQYEKEIAAELQVRQAEGSLAEVEAQIPVLEAALDIVRLPTEPVEIAIALSIVYAAASALREHAVDRRWVLTFFFGLVHGFGFASVLRESGLPPGGGSFPSR